MQAIPWEHYPQTIQALLHGEDRSSRKEIHQCERPDPSRDPADKELSSRAAKSVDGVSEVTVVLTAIKGGDHVAAEKLLVLVYDELRRLAVSKLAREAPGHTLQPTALVHEAWLRLVGDHARSFNDRTHFFRASAEAMRRILIDRARRKKTQCHGGGLERIDFDCADFELPSSSADDHLLAVNAALEKFALAYPVQTDLVKLRYFAGLTNEEVADVMGISLSTVKNYWRFSRSWLLNEIGSA